jgi:hypothetical protein
MLFAIPVEITSPAYYRPGPPIHRHITIVEGGPLPSFGRSGTGGVEDVRFAMSRQGYNTYTILPHAMLRGGPATAVGAYVTFTDLMKEVKAGFGRTMSHLPAIFGVSRQTLYNWINGETPKEHHRTKLVELAAAARVFTEAGFKPTALSFERTVAQGKSFSELIAQGANGKEMAERLVRIERRGVTARAKLDALLGDRQLTRLEPSNMERPAFNEDV